MITKFVSLPGDYSLCKWIDEHYGNVEIITVVRPDPMSSYKVFYQEINNKTNDTKEPKQNNS